MNALKHGLDARSAVIPGEDPDEYGERAESYRAYYCPATPEEEFFVESIIVEAWRCRRYARMETALTRKLMEQMEPCENALAAVFCSDTPDSRMLDRLMRHREAANRAWWRARQRLIQIIQQRLDAAGIEELAPPAPMPAPPKPPERTQSAPPPAVNSPERTQSAAGFRSRNDFGPIPAGISKEERDRLLALRL